MVGVEERTEREITSLESEIELENPRVRPAATRYDGYGIKVTVDYNEGTKLHFAGQNSRDLWLREQDFLRAAFPNKNATVILDIFVANARIADKYNVPKVFGDVVRQSVAYLVERAGR